MVSPHVAAPLHSDAPGFRADEHLLRVQVAQRLGGGVAWPFFEDLGLLPVLTDLIMANDPSHSVKKQHEEEAAVVLVLVMVMMMVMVMVYGSSLS
jgi:hypothetical protein